MKFKKYAISSLGLLVVATSIFVYSCKRDLLPVESDKKDFEYYKSNIVSDPDVIAVVQNDLIHTNIMLNAAKRRVIIRMQGGKVPDSLKRVAKASTEDIAKQASAAKTREDIQKIFILRGYQNEAQTLESSLYAMNQAFARFVKKNKEFKDLPKNQQIALLKIAFRTLSKDLNKRKSYSLFRNVQESGDNGMACLDAFSLACEQARVVHENSVISCLQEGLACEGVCIYVGGAPPVVAGCMVVCLIYEAICENSASTAYDTDLDFAEANFDLCKSQQEHQNTASLRKITTI